MTKAVLENMVKWMAVELMKDDIRVNVFSPGIIKTRFSLPLWDNDTTPEKAKGTSEDMAGVCAMMCSDDGKFINGESFYIHGGYAHL